MLIAPAPFKVRLLVAPVSPTVNALLIAILPAVRRVMLPVDALVVTTPSTEIPPVFKLSPITVFAAVILFNSI